MIVAFATLFLGLTLGPHPVTLTVAEPVAEVELLLDGVPIRTLAGEPWTASVDFGPVLAPHLLVAVARDSEGEELGRAVQRINLPRSPAEADVVIQPGGEGRATVALVTWESLTGAEPRIVTAMLDGRPVKVDDPHRVVLPSHDPDQLHFLRVELEFDDNVSTVVEATFGGLYQDRSQTELTALPVVPTDGVRRLAPAEMEGWFATVEGEPLRPVAVEDGPGEVVVIVDGGIHQQIWDLGRRWTYGAATSRMGARSGSGRIQNPGYEGPGDVTADRVQMRVDIRSMRHEMQLAKGETLRFLWPVPRPVQGESAYFELYPRSEEHPPNHGGVFWLLHEASPPPFDLSRQRLADAVAVAGMTATARSRRRAVVLVTGPSPVDASKLSPVAARRYLERMGVPLFVWSVGEPTAELQREWGEVRRVDARHRFAEAVRELRRNLASQRIVWLQGRHLPQQVAVTGQADVRRAR